MEAKLKNDTELNLKYEPKKKNNVLLYLILIILSIVFLAPIFIVLYFFRFQKELAQKCEGSFL